MMRLIFSILFLAFAIQATCQVDPQLLLGLTRATSNEISSLTGAEEGQMLYNTDTKEVQVFNGSVWVSSTNPGWLLNGNDVTSNSFLGSINDNVMELRSNNITMLQLGRRQTLGLTQNYPDYNNDNQYVTHVMGANGVSALQFQANAANFYKPMFFTNTDGNFRLKGSAAGTDFFELGSTGISNNGQFEFIIGDDGSEPFIFKRYDYRDQLLKELMRIQGSSDTQNARPRVGIATNSLANSTLQVNGSLAMPVSTATSNITLDETHHTVIINSNLSVTLPSAINATGRIYVLKNSTNTAQTISSYTDDTGSNATQINPQTTLWLQSDGSTWNSISPSDTTIITNLNQDTTTGVISYSNENNNSQTANVISTDTNNSISVGSDGGAYLKINFGGRWTNTNTTTDLNIDNTIAPIFGNEDYKDDGNNLYEITGNTLIVKEAGRYNIVANLSLLGENSPSSTHARTNVNVRLAVNGIPIGAKAASGYIRFTGGHEQSSLHTNEILQLNANDILTLVTYRGANSGTVRFSGIGESSFLINKLR